MSKPTFYNPFARGAHKTAGGTERWDSQASTGLGRGWSRRRKPSGCPPSEARDDAHLNFEDDELAMAMLSPPVRQSNVVNLQSASQTQTFVGVSLDHVEAVPARAHAIRSQVAPTSSRPPAGAQRTRKGSIPFRKNSKINLDPAPLLRRMATFLRPKETSAEIRRRELRGLLAQNDLPEPPGLPPMYVPEPPRRPPRPPYIEPEMLEIMGHFPSPEALSPGRSAARRAIYVTTQEGQESQYGDARQPGPLHSEAPPLPPPKPGRVGGSLPTISVTRQKIGVAAEMRGRSRRRAPKTLVRRKSHWEVLQMNKLPVPVSRDIKWLSGGWLGQGGFATVYLVYDIARDKQCAMKVVHFARGMSESACRGTINELKVLSRLADDSSPHPFLLQPYVGDEMWAWRSTKGYLHVLTEFCPGGDLSYYKRQLPERTLALICAEVILGLNHLHELGIVHHDLKPQNILVNADGHCVISDYGGAQFLDSGGEIRRKERAVGNAVMTIPFAAPELLYEDNTFRTYNQAVDYWSLGATLVSLIMDDDMLPGAQDTSFLTFRVRRIENKMHQLGKSQDFTDFVLAVSRSTQKPYVRLDVHPSSCWSRAR
ncbi:kinase-like protein [Trametes sanguinea]|nr:kinase-like protein [Trametes sanguinea]